MLYFLSGVRSPARGVAMATRGHCAGQIVDQPLRVITAGSVPARGKFVCNSPELEALTRLSRCTT